MEEKRVSFLSFFADVPGPRCGRGCRGGVWTAGTALSSLLLLRTRGCDTNPFPHLSLVAAVSLFWHSLACPPACLQQTARVVDADWDAFSSMSVRSSPVASCGADPLSNRLPSFPSHPTALCVPEPQRRRGRGLVGGGCAGCAAARALQVAVAAAEHVDEPRAQHQGARAGRRRGRRRGRRHEQGVQPRRAHRRSPRRRRLVGTRVGRRRCRRRGSRVRVRVGARRVWRWLRLRLRGPRRRGACACVRRRVRARRGGAGRCVWHSFTISHAAHSIALGAAPRSWRRACTRCRARTRRCTRRSTG